MKGLKQLILKEGDDSIDSEPFRPCLHLFFICFNKYDAPCLAPPCNHAPSP